MACNLLEIRVLLFVAGIVSSPFVMVGTSLAQEDCATLVASETPATFLIYDDNCGTVPIEICNPRPPLTLEIETGTALCVQLSYGPGACTAANFTIFVDGVERGSSGFLGSADPARACASSPCVSSVIDLGPVSAGRHTLTFSGECQGGCFGPEGFCSVGATMKVYTNDAPTIEITSISVSSGGELQAGDTLPFAGGDNWGNRPPDFIECSAEVVGMSDPIVEWSVTDLSVGRAEPFFRLTFGSVPDFFFRVVDLGPHDLYTPREPAISFKIVARLLDADLDEIDRDWKVVTQSALGRRRQEYVDHTVIPPVDTLPKVPAVSDFVGLEIISDWAAEAELRVLTESPLETVRTSLYRSPVENWRLYRRLRLPTNCGSQHMWGCAVDFGVFDYTNDGEPDRSDWALLAQILRIMGFRVVDEGVSNHVHIQKFGRHRDNSGCMPRGVGRGGAVEAISLFVRGDSNASGTLDLSDSFFTVDNLFAGGPFPSCEDATDANDDGSIDVSDVVYTLHFLFLGGPPPPPPYVECGQDSTEDGLVCDHDACR